MGNKKITRELTPAEKMKEHRKKKIIKLAKDFQREIILLNKLNSYIYKHLEGKTVTNGLHAEIKRIRGERQEYLRNILFDLNHNYK